MYKNFKSERDEKITVNSYEIEAKQPKKVAHRKPLVGKKPKREELISVFEFEKIAILIFEGHLEPREQHQNDFIVEYWLPEKTRSSRPNHYVWSCDLLVKKQKKSELCNEYIDSLLEFWDKADPLTEPPSYENMCGIVKTYFDNVMDKKYKELSKYGYFNIETLSSLIVFLAIQEKSNRADSTRIPTILNCLKEKKINIPQFVFNAGPKKLSKKK